VRSSEYGTNQLFPGTTSAFTSAYVLAGEILSHPDDLSLAFTNHDQKLRPFINEIQQISTWAWSIVMPYSHWTIILVHFVVGWLTYLGIPELMRHFSKEDEPTWRLPEYSVLDELVKREE
jgi:small-conductance mechanosensitive channel